MSQTWYRRLIDVEATSFAYWIRIALNHLLHGLKISKMEEDMEAKLFAVFSLISIPYRESKNCHSIIQCHQYFKKINANILRYFKVSILSNVYGRDFSQK